MLLGSKLEEPTKFWGVCPVLSMFCGVNPPRCNNVKLTQKWTKRTKAVQWVGRLTSLRSQLTFLGSWIDHLILGKRSWFSSYCFSLDCIAELVPLPGHDEGSQWKGCWKRVTAASDPSWYFLCRLWNNARCGNQGVNRKISVLTVITVQIYRDKGLYYIYI